MIYLNEDGLESQINELTLEEKLKLIHFFFRNDISEMPVSDIAIHISNCPEDYKGVVHYTPEPMDENDHYQTYCERPEYAI